MVKLSTLKPQVMGYATTCLLASDQYDRPIFGTLVLNPDKINATAQDKYYEQTFYTILHEICHVMAFNPELWSSFIDPVTKKKLPITSVYKFSKGFFALKIL